MQRRQFILASAAAAVGLAACSGDSSSAPTTAASRTGPGTSERGGSRPTSSTSTSTSTTQPVPGEPAEILARSTVPIINFHQLRAFEPDDSSYARTLITPPEVLRTQLEAVRDDGYQTVKATELVDHLQFGDPLPERPVLVTFDDGSSTHATVALPLLEDLGFSAVFFPMTVVLDKPDWLSSDQLRQLDAAGMEIGAHTWDHQRMDRLSGDQWAEQLIAPKAELEEILGHPVDLLAYPNGLWTQESLTQVADAGYRAAFQLAEATDPQHPLLTIRRIQPPPTWDGPTLLGNLQAEF